MRPRIRSWLQQQRWSLLALVVLVPAAVLLALSVDFFGYQASRMTVAVEVARGESGEYGPASFELRGFEIIGAGTAAAIEHDVPEGLDLVVADLWIEPEPGPLAEDAPLSCEITLVSADDEPRRWDEGARETRYPRDFSKAAYCEFDETEPYELEQLYLVPSGAAEGAHLEVSSLVLLPRVLRLY